MHFTLKNPDFSLSPRTGMTRGHWIECARFILEGAFSHVRRLEDPLVFPKVEGKSYPHADDPPWRHRAMEFEGLSRTLNVAAPLLHVDPDATICGHSLRDYYKHHLLQVVTPGSPTYIPRQSELPDDRYQMTCEFGGLATCLLAYPDVLWPHFSRAEQDQIAVHLSDWAHGRTTSHNWRYFNVMMLTFLKKHGYAIDDELLSSHLDYLLACCGGDGWFQDAHFDFYSVWVFNLYGMVWSRAWGDEHDPQRVAVMEKQFRDLMRSYPLFFGRDGKMLMWGRSICYRFGAACAFPLASLAQQPPAIEPGWARRLLSGALLDFVTRDDFWENEVPSLGFYAHWEPLLQPYSCAASPFWMFLPFVALSLPENSPFWTATENDGDWTAIGAGVKTQSLPGPGFHVSAHGPSGASELRPAKVHASDPNYSRLCYNTHFPWESDDPDGGTAMTFCARNLDGEHPWLSPQRIWWVGERDGVFYRQLLMNATGHRAPIDLAEIMVPGGVLQIARCRVYHPHTLTLGHFGLPHCNGEAARVENFARDGWNGLTAQIAGRRLALAALSGWDETGAKIHAGHHPEADQSTVLFAQRTRRSLYPRPELLVTLLLHRCDEQKWSDDELFPIEKVEISRYMPSGGLLGAQVRLKNGAQFTVDFNEIDGKLGG